MSTSTAAPGDCEPRVAAMLALPRLQAHNDDEHLSERVAHYLASGLRAGEPVLAIAPRSIPPGPTAGSAPP
jgi:hypothetical protein